MGILLRKSNREHNMKQISLKLSFAFMLLLFQIITVSAEPIDYSFKVVDVAETVFEDKPAIEVKFSEEIHNNSYYYNFLKIHKNDESINGSWRLSDDYRKVYFTNIFPENNYKITILPGLKSKNNETILEEKSFKITTSKMQPAYGFYDNGYILPRKLEGGLPIMTVNVDEVDIQFLRVKKDKLGSFLDRFQLQNSTSLWEMQYISNYADIAYSGRFAIKDKTENKRIKSQINIHQIDELSKPGMYVAVMARPGRYEYDKKTSFFFVSDIGLHIRKYKESYDIYTTSLTTGNKTGDVTLEFFNSRNQKLFETSSDHNGLATIKNSDFSDSNTILVARKGNDVSFMKLNSPAIDISEFDINGRSQEKLEAFIYSERDLYRPGETANISILARDHDGKNPTTQPLIVEVRKPDGNIYKNVTLSPSENGYYEMSVWIPGDAPTGNWGVQIKTEPNQKTYIAHYKIKVEEFHPERIKVDLSSEEDKNLFYSDPFDITISSEYLYGAPAAENRVTAVMNVNRNPHPLKEYKKYYFGSVKDDGIRIRKELLDAKLDKDGKTTIKIPAVQDKLSSPLNVRVTASVYESGGRSVTRSKNNVVWPAKTLIGIKPLFDNYVERNTPINFDIIKADRDGKLQSTSDLKVKVIYEERKYHWYYDENSGWQSSYSEAEHEIYKEDFAITADKAEKITLPPSSWGNYRIEIYDPETKLTANYRYRVGWYTESSNASSPSKVKLQLDKKSYKAGEAIKVKVTPPHAGNGVLIVESTKRLWNKQITVPQDGGTYEIPVDESWDTHNIYLTAIIFRPGNKNDNITPNRAIGITHIPLNRDNRKIDLAISAPEKIKPNTKLKVNVKINNPDTLTQPSKARLTLAAVDLGILNITNFETPNPNNYFFSKRRYEVESLDMYGKVIETVDSDYTSIKFGGDGYLESKRKNRLPKAKVKLVSLFSGVVDFDENGNAEVAFDIPDFNGRLRVMAVAFDNENFGSVDTEVTVASPIVTQISTPRFLTIGDVSLAALDVQNLSGREQNIELKLSSTSPIKEINKNEKLTLKDKEKTTLFFEIEPDDEFGVGTISMNLKSDDIEITRKWELAIRPAYPNLETSKFKVIKDGDKLELNKEWIEGLIDKTVNVNVKASLVPPLDLKNSVKGLFGYPYGCLEQTLSKAFPNLFIENDIADRIGIKQISMEERNKRFNKAISRLKGKQLASGGFGLWSKTSPEEPWLTPYAVEFLIIAKEQGFDVPDDMLKPAMENLERRVRNYDSFNFRNIYTSNSNHLHFASNAYAAYTLALIKKAPLGSLRNMYDYYSNNAASPLPLVHLGAALILQGDKRKGMKLIKQALKKSRSDRYLGDYGSNVRDKAMMIALIKKHNIKIDNSLIFDLQKDMRRRRYLSTQERIAIFRAGYYMINAKTETLTVGVHQDLIEERFETNGTFRRDFTTDEIREGIALEFHTNKDVYTTVSISGFTKKPPKHETKDINIVRTLYSMDGKKIDKRMFKTGETFIVKLDIFASKPVNDGLVVDLLPAGFEIENFNISQGENLSNMLIDGVSPIKAMGSYNIKHAEYRDDRFVAALSISNYSSQSLFYMVKAVSPGTFVVPPTFAEDMYYPDTRNIGKPHKNITISNPDS